MKNFFLILIALFMGWWLCSCHRWRHKHKNTYHVINHIGVLDNTFSEDFHENKAYCVLHIEGIECRQCIHAALRALSRVKGVIDVACHSTQKNYEHAWFSCSLTSDGTVLPVPLMQHRLHEQDLKLTSIEGSFKGIVITNKAKNVQLSIAGLNEPVQLVGAAETILQIQAESLKNANHHVRVTGKLEIATNRLTVTQQHMF